MRIKVIDDCSADQLMPFVQDNVAPGSSVVTDGWKGFNDLKNHGYRHLQLFQNKTAYKQSVVPGVYLVISLIKRLVLETFQGRYEEKHLQSYWDEYTFRFNRRNSKHVGKKFFRIVQQAVVSQLRCYNQIIAGAFKPAIAS